MNRIKLDEGLISRVRRSAHAESLTIDDRVALNLLWRKRVQVPILAKVFKCSRNTIYYKALTGKADSYPNSEGADEANALVDRFVAEVGLDEAVNRYVPADIVAAVNKANAAIAKTREKK
jgi:hypothetical protein